jgi:hypothetical protein
MGDILGGGERGTPSIDSFLPLFSFSTAKLSLVGGKEGRIGIELS